MRGCGADGDLDQGRYTEPLPWIGVYIATASLYCAGAMALDAYYSGIRNRKLWFSPKFFSLNSATLTVISIATKIPVDLNTPMPHAVDQLTKLSGTVLICTATANFLPSLGDSNVLSNVLAVATLIITVVVNIGIQMGTGVIFAFLPEHVIVMFLMMQLLGLVVSSAKPVAAIKHLLEQDYLAKHWRAVKEVDSYAEDASEDSVEAIPFLKLKEFIKRHWLMAHTCRAQYVLGRLATCTSSGAYCLFGALVLLQALLRVLLRRPGLRFCNGASDYGWSTTLVLTTQVAAVIVGTVAPVYRWQYVVHDRSICGEDRTLADVITVEKYWLERLKDSWLKMGAHPSDGFSLGMLLRLHAVEVLFRKFHRFLPAVHVGWLRQVMGMDSSSLSQQGAPPADNHLDDYVLHLEGGGELARTVKSEMKDAESWIEKGRKKQLEAPLKLIKKHSTFSEGFKHAGAFDSSGKEPLLPEEPPNCWSLPLVTLAAIVAALSGVQQKKVDQLLRGVKEGLKFVKLVEKNLDNMGLVNMRGAAESVWVGLELNKKWLDRDLRNLALRTGRDRRGKEVAEAAQSIAEQEVVDSVEKLGISKHVLSWPERTMAANCMYRVCTTIIQDYEEGRHSTDADLFTWLRRTISDILGACLTNLSRTLYMESFSHKFEERKKCVRDAALALGEAEGILQILKITDQVASRFPSRTQYLDDWKNRGRDV
ncbi:hypothetical protein Taro_051849 [Colocasia esculenta]|uniref:Uncharacterized protein n=1 Tax=Colocasia esculenta TaxID=4460 RepID=A0A843XHX4_COLES|nr:hypothetical protein [Colocasia esculenta]